MSYLQEYLHNMKERVLRVLRIMIHNKDPRELTLDEYRKAGIKIGDNCHIYSRLPKGRDCFLLSIGDNVTISSEVGFIFHDNAVIKPTNGKYTDLLGGISIGNNC